MKMTITVPREVDVKYLHCYVQVRYWEDSEINEQADDEEGTLIKNLLPNAFMSREAMMKLGLPERYAEGFLHIVIDLDEGKVVDWPKGNCVSLSYKTCDMNVFVLTDNDKEVIFQTPKGDTEYVIGPKFMNEYGDYFVLQVDEEGKIKDWNQKEMIAALQIWMGEVC